MLNKNKKKLSKKNENKKMQDQAFVLRNKIAYKAPKT